MSDGWGSDKPAAALPEQAAKPSTTKAPEHADKLIIGWTKPVAYDYTETDTDRQWDSNAPVYEWKGGDDYIGPVHPVLENEIFGHPDQRHGAGVDFSKIAEIQVRQEGLERIIPVFEFKDAGLHPVMLENVDKAGYKTPTAIQKYCLPAINMGYDLIAIAQTGSGKTAAYFIPILNELMGKAKKLVAPRPTEDEAKAGKRMRAEPLVLVLCPTRELATQIFFEARKFCYRTMLRPCVIYGGGPLNIQIDQIGQGCDVLIATPGRLIDIMYRPNSLSLRRLRYMVIDEADELLESDWQEDLEKILSGGEHDEGNVRHLLFSATFPAAVRKVAKEHLAMNHIRLHVGRIGSTHSNIAQDVIFVRQDLKKTALIDLLTSMKPCRVIVFVNSKRTADEIDDFLYHKGLPCTSMHSDRTQREREDAMRAFRAGETPILVTTGVTARGIDVHNVKTVINYDLPNVDHGGIQNYIHRIGRTGRIGYTGSATSFYTDNDEPLAVDLTKILMESEQPVPNFLQQYIPDGVDPKNYRMEDDDSEAGDDDDNWIMGISKGGKKSAAGKGDPWGADSNTKAAGANGANGANGAVDDWGGAPKAGTDDGWGSTSKTKADDGWGSTSKTKADDGWGDTSKAGANKGWGNAPNTKADDGWGGGSADAWGSGGNAGAESKGKAKAVDEWGGSGNDNWGGEQEDSNAANGELDTAW